MYFETLDELFRRFVDDIDGTSVLSAMHPKARKDLPPGVLEDEEVDEDGDTDPDEVPVNVTPLWERAQDEIGDLNGLLKEIWVFLGLDKPNGTATVPLNANETGTSLPAGLISKIEAFRSRHPDPQGIPFEPGEDLTDDEKCHHGILKDIADAALAAWKKLDAWSKGKAGESGLREAVKNWADVLRSRQCDISDDELIVANNCVRCPYCHGVVQAMNHNHIACGDIEPCPHTVFVMISEHGFEFAGHYDVEKWHEKALAEDPELDPWDPLEFCPFIDELHRIGGAGHGNLEVWFGFRKEEVKKGEALWDGKTISVEASKLTVG